MTKHTSIEPIERATNRSWADWLTFMDKIGAKDLEHHAIAEKLYKELEGTLENYGWWAQNITIAYEQHIGRRIPGQSSDGTFQTSVSKSTQLNMRDLMDAWTEFASQDRSVRDLIASKPKLSGTEKRLNWRAKAKDGSSIQITSEPKRGAESAAIIATQLGNKTPEDNDRAKETWSNIISRFASSL